MVSCPRCHQEFTLMKWLAVGAAHMVWDCPAISVHQIGGEEE